MIEVRYTEGGELTAYALINPNASASFELPEGEWKALLMNEAVTPGGGESLSGTVTVDGRTVLLVCRP